MAEPCMSSQGEFKIKPSSRSALRAAHSAAISPPVEWPISSSSIMVGRDQVGSRVKLDGVIVEVGDEAPELPAARMLRP